MKNRANKFLGWSKRTSLSLALFVLVISATVALKAQADDLIMGWLWGGSEDASLGSGTMGSVDGNESGVGWVKLNNGSNIKVTIDDSTGKVSGYGWMNANQDPDQGENNGLGWLDFNPQDHCTTGVPVSGQYRAASCNPADAGLNCGPNIGVYRDSVNKKLTGCARVVSIAVESYSGNSGGWSGWMKLGDVMINDPIASEPDNWHLSGYAWNGETPPGSALNIADGLGFIDFRMAYITKGPPDPADCFAQCGAAELMSFCEGSSGPQITDPLCVAGYNASPVVADATGFGWTCSCPVAGGTDDACHVNFAPKVDAACGSMNGGTFCDGGTITDLQMCTLGTSSLTATSINNDPKLVDTYEVTWTCGGGACGGSDASCSAKGTKACGWVETNP